MRRDTSHLTHAERVALCSWCYGEGGTGTGKCSSCGRTNEIQAVKRPAPRTAARHSLTGERFREMGAEKLRRVLTRTYKYAADTAADQRAAQAELRRRRELHR